MLNASLASRACPGPAVAAAGGEAIARGWVLYDGRCRMCRRGARLFARSLQRRGFAIQPLQRRWARRMLNLDGEPLLGQMRVARSDGRVYGGADAVVHLSRFIWWAWPVLAIAVMPGGMMVLGWAYGLIARNRSCIGGACGSHQGTSKPQHQAHERMLRQERGGVFRSDWKGTLFLHFEVDPSMLAPLVPFELDVFPGQFRERFRGQFPGQFRGRGAIVSVVAFSMRNFRVRGTGIPGMMLFAPATLHGLLNVRAYVRHEGNAGIYFLTEWVPNPLSVLLGPRLFGLPYRFGRLAYEHDHEGGVVRGVARSPELGVRFGYAVEAVPTRFAPAEPDSLDEFLLERYTAYTSCSGRRRFFHIWHEPWPQAAVDVRIEDRGLLGVTAPWLAEAPLIGAHYSPGVRNVWIGRPRRIGP